MPRHYQSSDNDDKNQRQLSPNANFSRTWRDVQLKKKLEFVSEAAIIHGIC